MGQSSYRKSFIIYSGDWYAKGGATMSVQLAKDIHDYALECGYDSCGIIPIEALEFFKDRLE